MVSVKHRSRGKSRPQKPKVHFNAMDMHDEYISRGHRDNKGRAKSVTFNGNNPSKKNKKKARIGSDISKMKNDHQRSKSHSKPKNNNNNNNSNDNNNTTSKTPKNNSGKFVFGVNSMHDEYRERKKPISTKRPAKPHTFTFDETHVKKSSTNKPGSTRNKAKKAKVKKNYFSSKDMHDRYAQANDSRVAYRKPLPELPYNKINTNKSTPMVNELLSSTASSQGVNILLFIIYIIIAILLLLGYINRNVGLY